jgi:hypothetical protein
MVEDIKLFMSRDPGAQQFKAQYDEMMNKNEEEVNSMVTPLFERNMTADELVRIGEERGEERGAVKMLLSLEYTESEISARTGLSIERVRSITKELSGSAS